MKMINRLFCVFLIFAFSSSAFALAPLSNHSPSVNRDKALKWIESLLFQMEYLDSRLVVHKQFKFNKEEIWKRLYEIRFSDERPVLT